MKNQYQESEEILCVREQTEETYTYSLITLCSEATVRYGIAIRLEIDGENYVHTPPDLFSSREGALRFLSFLSQNLITPANLPDIIEDLLTDFDRIC